MSYGTGWQSDDDIRDFNFFTRVRNPVFLRSPGLTTTGESYSLEGRFGARIAVDLASGDIAWRSVLGTIEALEAIGIRNTGTVNLGGSIATAGGLVMVENGNVQRQSIDAMRADSREASARSISRKPGRITPPRNVPLSSSASIVTAVPGTTRDMIQEVVNIGGLPVTLIDTAGVRESGDPVEQEGVRLTLSAIPRADLVIFLLDSSRSFDDDDQQILGALAGRRCLVVCNKADLSQAIHLPGELAETPFLSISTKSGEGIDSLKDAIAREFLHGHAVDSREYVALSRARHRDALVKAASALVKFTSNHESGLPPEILTLDLRDALSAIGEVTGETTPDEILDLIFSQFCVGK